MSSFQKHKIAVLILSIIVAAESAALAFRGVESVNAAEAPSQVASDASPEPAVPRACIEPLELPEAEAPKIDCPLDAETQGMIFAQCEDFGVDFAFTMAVIFTESSFRPDVISYDGSSVGLMQINKINHGWLSEKLGITNFFDPEQNVKAGLYMLSELFRKYEDPAKVCMAYNLGETGARRLWDQGIYSTSYSEKVLQRADKYKSEIEEVKNREMQRYLRAVRRTSLLF